MNKGELIADVAERMYMSKKDTDKILSIILGTITEALAEGKKVKLKELGTFEVKTRSEKTVKNPQNGERMILPSKKAPFFKAGRILKETINK